MHSSICSIYTVTKRKSDVKSQIGEIWTIFVIPHAVWIIQGNAVIWTCFEQLLLPLLYHLCVFVLYCTYHDAESNVISQTPTFCCCMHEYLLSLSNIQQLMGFTECYCQ
jgi:hypothetical protein